MARAASSLPITAGLALSCLITSTALAVPSDTTAPPIARVTASSTRLGEASGAASPSNLTDGAPDTWWEPGGRSPRFAWVRFELGGPARVDGLVIANGRLGHDGDGLGFSTYGRLRSAWVLFDDGSAEVIRLDPQRRGARWVILARMHSTRTLTLVVRDVELGERWNHIALSEVSITGRRDDGDAAEPSPLPPSPEPCGTPGWLPLRDAVVAYCGDPATTSHCEDPILDVVLGCRADPGHPLPPFDPTAVDRKGTSSWTYPGRWFAVKVDLLRTDGGGWRATNVSLTDEAGAASP